MALLILLSALLIAVGLGLVLLKLRPRSFRLKATATRWFQLEVEMTDPTERAPAALQSIPEGQTRRQPGSDAGGGCSDHGLDAVARTIALE